MNFLRIISLVLIVLIFGCEEQKELPPKKVEVEDPNVIKPIIEEVKEDSVEVVISAEPDSIIPIEIKLDSLVVPDSLVNVEDHIKIDFTEGIYLSAYMVRTKYYPDIISLADSAGINTVVFDIKNMNGAIFMKDVQKSSLLDYTYEPLLDVPKLVKELHSKNMKAVARIVMFHDINLATNFPHLRPKSKSGEFWLEQKRRDPSWLDSSNPVVQQSLLHLIEQVAQKGVDEIQLDYVRFPTQGKLSDALFRFAEEDSIKALNDSLYVKREKRDIIKDFLRRVKNVCKTYDVNVTTDVFAIAAWQRKADIANTGQDFSYMGQHADAIHPMIYTSHFAKGFGRRKDVYNEPYQIMFQGTALSKKAVGDSCEVIPYIQANSWRVNYKKEYMDAQIEAIRDAGGQGYILWNAQNRYTKTLRWIKELKEEKLFDLSE